MSFAPWKSKNEAVKASRVSAAGGDLADEDPGVVVFVFVFAAVEGEPPLCSWRGGMAFPVDLSAGRLDFERRKDRWSVEKGRLSRVRGPGRSFLSSSAAAVSPFAVERQNGPRLHSVCNVPLQLKLLVVRDFEVSPRRLRRKKGDRGPGRPARRGGSFSSSVVFRAHREKEVKMKFTSSHFLSYFYLSLSMTRPAPQPLPVARFVGSAAVGKQRLVQALLAQSAAERRSSSSEAKQSDDESSEAPIAADANGSLDPESSCSSRSHLWELETRYYTARLSLERSRIEVEEEEEEGSAAAAAEAVVLVFDPAREATFAAATRWWSSKFSSSSSEGGGEGGDPQQEPAVKLCVAHGEDKNTESEDLRSRAEAWCVDNAFELIEVSSSLPAPASASASAPSLEACEGISRLRDALAAHTWLGLSRKSHEEVEAARRTAVAEAERRRRKKERAKKALRPELTRRRRRSLLPLRKREGRIISPLPRRPP